MCVCRVGRTARGTGGKGKALLFLMPEELGFLHYLKDSKVSSLLYSFILVTKHFFFCLPHCF